MIKSEKWKYNARMLLLDLATFTTKWKVQEVTGKARAGVGGHGGGGIS